MGYYNEGFQGSLLHKFMIKTSQPFISVAKNYYKNIADESEIFKKVSSTILGINGIKRDKVIPEDQLRNRFAITSKPFVSKIFDELKRVNNVLTISLKNNYIDPRNCNVYGMRLGFNPRAYIPGGRLGDIESTNINYNHFLSKGWSCTILKPIGKGHNVGFIFKLNTDKIDEVYCLTTIKSKNSYELKPYKMKFINSINPKTYLKTIVIDPFNL